MLLGHAQGEATRVRDLVVALEQEEITLNEFHDAVEVLTPEAVQVTSLLLRGWMDVENEEHYRFLCARLICRSMATRTRSIS